MSDDLEHALTAILKDHCTYDVVAASEHGLSVELWEQLSAGGFTGVGVPEEVGGSGGDLMDAAAVIRVAARYAAPLPLVESILEVGGLCAATGLDFPTGPTAVAIGTRDAPIRAARTGSDWTFTGGAERVPWARNVEHLIVVGRSAEGEDVAGLVERDACTAQPGLNLADEPRDAVTLEGVTAAPGRAVIMPPSEVDALGVRAALGRSLQMAGALEGALALSIQYANERVQFGRPIGRFQAVQHLIAALAGETAAAVAVSDAAARAVLAGGGELRVAAAKIRTGMAAGEGARLAHQVHGAIGYTREHRLQHLTRRLWSWRDEHGSEQMWATRLGHEFASSHADGVWDLVTTVTGSTA